MLIKALKRIFGSGGGAGSGGSSNGDGGEGHGSGGGSEMISCQDAMSRLQEFIDGELPGLSHDEVEAHFEVCTRCYPHLALEKSFRARVQAALGKPDVPAGLRNRVMGMLAQDEGGGE